MRYTLNEYYKIENSSSIRVEVYSNNITAIDLLAHHLQNGVKEISIHECVDKNTYLLPMPCSLMPVLDNRILSIPGRVVVSGIDSYLSLISKRDRKAFMNALHNRIDENKMNVIYLISRNQFDKSVFANPKYENALQIVYIGEEGQYFAEPCVRTVSNKWVKQDNNPTNWKELLKVLGQFEPTGDYMVVFDNDIKIQAGLSSNVTQITDIISIAQQFYKLPAFLDEKLLEKIIVECRKNDKTAGELLRERFGAENVALHLVVKRLLELQTDELWMAYIWYVRQMIDSNTYLARVLTNDVTVASLLRSYCCATAIDVLNDENAQHFAKERATGIKELGDETLPFMNEFITLTKLQPDNIIVKWLNCGKEIEKIEIVRRVAEDDLTIGLSPLWSNSYLLLTDYLTDAYEYTDKELTEYFREYRRLKIADKVTEQFVKKAFDSSLQGSFVYRDKILQELSADSGTALLVIDGMGAEYYPLLCALAKRYMLNIESATVAAVRLPSSTEYNKIIWDKDRLLEAIHGIDNISHDGVEKFEQNTSEQNIVATLSKFEIVMKRISSALQKYQRVVVTADHGSSRLAVIAYEEGLNETLPWSSEPMNCRYVVAPQNEPCPLGFEPYYDVDRNITYWMVRGYNRLPKKGKMCVHGGATLEERLVPVIVFAALNSGYDIKLSDNKTTEQLVEKAGFDDI